jgi:glycosyltransferase involved in cell wall biosynthesis
MNPHAVVRLRKVLDEFKPDVVHVKMFLTQLSPLILPLLRNFPSVLHVINYDLICPVNTKQLPDGSPCHFSPGRVCHDKGCMSWAGVLRSTVQRRLTRLDVFDYIVANSQWVAQRLRTEEIPVDDWLDNSVSIQPARPDLESEPMVGFAGRLVKKKGVDVLIRAMSILLRREPSARLVIVGDGPERPRLEGLVVSLKIGHAVHFTGHLAKDAMETALARVWVQVVPSKWEEPFGLVAAEAMMRGTACITTDSGGLGELVTKANAGSLVPPGDPEALAVSIESLLADRDHANRLGQNGRLYALSRLTHEVHIDRLVEIYSKVLGGDDNRAGQPPSPRGRQAFRDH